MFKTLHIYFDFVFRLWIDNLSCVIVYIITKCKMFYRPALYIKLDIYYIQLSYIQYVVFMDYYFKKGSLNCCV